MIKTDIHIYKGYVWRVYHHTLGLTDKFMDRIFDQFDRMLERYSKVFVVRIDLHLDEYSSSNKIMSDYLKEILINLKRKYGCEIGYAWAREFNIAEAQHYHLVLMLNGHKICYPSSLLKIATEIWKASKNGYLFTPKNCYYMAKRGVSQLAQQVIYRLSYLAKKHTKGRRDNHAKDYQTSRLKPLKRSDNKCYLITSEA